MIFIEYIVHHNEYIEITELTGGNWHENTKYFKDAARIRGNSWKPRCMWEEEEGYIIRYVINNVV